MELNPQSTRAAALEWSAESLAASIELLWRCRTLAQKGRLLQTRTAVVGTQASPVTAPAAPGTATRQSVTTAYDPYAGRRTSSARAVGWLLARAAWLIFGESRSSSVARVSSKQTRVR